MAASRALRALSRSGSDSVSPASPGRRSRGCRPSSSRTGAGRCRAPRPAGRRRGRPSRPSRAAPTARSAGRRAGPPPPPRSRPGPWRRGGRRGARPGPSGSTDARGEAIADGGRGGHPGVQPEAGAAGMRTAPGRSRRCWPGRRRPASRRGPRRPSRRPARPRATGPARTRGWAGPRPPPGAGRPFSRASWPESSSYRAFMPAMTASEGYGVTDPSSTFGAPTRIAATPKGGRSSTTWLRPATTSGTRRSPRPRSSTGAEGGAVSTVSSRIG